MYNVYGKNSIDTTNHNNFLLDTNVFNNITKDELLLLEYAIENKGYNYFYTDVQTRELEGKKYDGTIKNFKESESLLLKFDKMIDKLKITRVPNMASPMEDFTRVDGSCYFSSTDERRKTLDASIRKKTPYNPYGNIKHLEDAIIADAAIFSNLKLVTGDKRLYKRMYELYPNNILWFRNFIEKITKLQMD